MGLNILGYLYKIQRIDTTEIAACKIIPIKTNLDNEILNSIDSEVIYRCILDQ